MTIIQRAAKAATAGTDEDRAAAQAAAAAPDSKAGGKYMRGKREMFTVGFEPELMEEFDAARQKLGLSRPALIKIAVRRLLDSGV